MMANDSITTVDLIIAIGTIATPVLLIVISGVGWYFKGRIESSWKTEAELRKRAEKLEEATREDRLQVYNEILEPFIILFTKENSLQTNKRQRGKTKEQRVLEIVQSLEYRQAAFKLSIFAHDDVVNAYNNLMQFSYKTEGANVPSEGHASEATGRDLLIAFGDFLLAIRKSVGNEKSSLSNIDMLTWMITDIEKVRRQ